jgi:hypothetical protein
LTSVAFGSEPKNSSRNPSNASAADTGGTSLLVALNRTTHVAPVAKTTAPPTVKTARKGIVYHAKLTHTQAGTGTAPITSGEAIPTITTTQRTPWYTSPLPRTGC